MNQLNYAIKYGRELFLAGVNNAGNGNLSFRKGQEIYITKSGAVLSELTKKEIVKIDSPLASSEAPTHRLLMTTFPKINAVFHTHSANAIALSLKTKKKFVTALDLEGRYHFNKIPIIVTEMVPNAKDLPEKVVANQAYQAVIIKGHGIFTFGASIREAYLKNLTVDNICKIILLSGK